MEAVEFEDTAEVPSLPHWMWSSRTGARSDRGGIDLHSHSSRSDGSDTPGELVVKAKEFAGLSVIALTDHDTTAGWAEASRAALWVGIGLVRGLELTTKDDGATRHLLAYEPDPSNPALRRMLTETSTARDSRIPQMVQLIAALEPRLTLADVLKITGDATPGRPHIADAMVAAGIVRDRGEAFQRFLGPGCPTYISRWAPRIEDAIGIVAAAGGVTVIAHPRGRGSKLDADHLAELAAVGLSGVEVDHQEHSAGVRQELRSMARELNLITTGSSDYHGTGKHDHELGCNTTRSEEFDRLLAALDSAQSSATAELRGVIR